MMGFSENTLKKLKDAVRSVQEKTEGKEEAVRDACAATEKVVLQAVAHRLITNRLAEKAQEAVQTAAKPTFGSVAEHLLLGNLRVLNLGFRMNAIEELAGAIDRLLEKPEEEAEEEPLPEEPVQEEPVVEEEPNPVEEEPIPEEPAVEAFVTVEEPVAEVENEENETDEDAEDDENEDDSLAGIDTEGLEFIDVMAEPERYAEMQEQERQGLVRLVSRYRRSFLSRLSQSRGNVQEYYSVIKNAFLSYKGVKGRVSWGYESFNRGRVKLAKVNAKSSTLYVYLALDPATLEGTKYFFTDVSNKKKYAATPVLLKIKGERKLKHALELIEKLCAEQNALPSVKDYEAVDYTIAEQTTEELVQAGLIRQFTAAVPVGAFETGIVLGE
ncbi:MAG TPA: hypothetical protein DDW30_02000 [Clostridiales bacterium]|nr:hypothetical protein [Clostridiales bacterium]